MKLIRLSGAIIVFLCLFFTVQPQLQAQNLGNIDFATVKVDNLSDAQIMQIWVRAQEENLSVQEISVLAQSRGMPAAEVSKLQSRLNQVRMRTDSDVADTQTGSLRQAENMSEEVDDMTQVTTVEQPDSQLRVFGSNLFRDRSITFEPSVNIPTPVDYVLGVGDEIIINIWGAAEANYELTVTPEGVVRIPSLGPVQLAGLSIQEARERLLSRLQDIYSGLRPGQPNNANTYADVSLGNVRSIKVTIVGEVTQPGTYTISSLATVFNALYASGGPTNSGTFRNIQIIRGNTIADTLDIYDFLVYGDQSDNIRLRDQDIIKIDPYLSRVELRGEVKQPAVFEMKGGETLGDLVEYASGFTERAFTNRLVLRRNTDTQRSISDVSWPEGSNLALQSGDEIRVGELLDRFENRVSILGAVFREGEYELNEGLMLTGLIEKASGLREDAYMQRGVIFRTQDDLTVSTLAFSVADVMNGVSDDISLQRDDVVQISSLFDLQEEYTIRVIGAVNEGGEFTYVENLTISDAIYLADGFRESAAPYRIELSRRLTDENRFIKGNQLAERFQFEIDENLDFNPEDENFQLEPFDQIFVRKMPNYRVQQNVQISGEVNFPGNYVLENRNARISDLIEWAGGLSDFAYPEGASLIRNPDGNDQILQDLEAVDEQIRIDNSGNSKVGIQLVEIMRNPGSEEDLRLEPGDVLEIPTELQTVSVEGEVLFPVQVRYEKGLSLRDAVSKAGGFTNQALKKRAYVVYANGEVDRTRRFLFFKNDPSIEPGATVVIPAKEQEADLSPQERIAIYSTIVSMAAIVTSTIFQIRR